MLFVSPPRYVYLLRQLQLFLYLVIEAAFAQTLNFNIVAPNLRVSAMTWRLCENSFPALLVEVSKALQAYTGYQGNSQLMADDATAFDFGMQVAHRTSDENGLRQVKEPNTAERINMMDNLWFERRDEQLSTHDPEFHKELLALLKETKEMKSNRNVFAVVSPTLVLPVMLAHKIAQENRATPQLLDQSWHAVLHETLAQVAEIHGYHFRSSYTISHRSGYPAWPNAKVA